MIDRIANSDNNTHKFTIGTKYEEKGNVGMTIVALLFGGGFEFFSMIPRQDTV